MRRFLLRLVESRLWGWLLLAFVVFSILSVGVFALATSGTDQGYSVVGVVTITALFCCVGGYLVGRLVRYVVRFLCE